MTFLFRRSQRPQPDAIEVIIGPRATYNGSLRSDTSIRVDGVVESGLLETAANVVLTETAEVNCEIRARVVSIRGRFDGIIHAERVELLAGCHASGALYVDSFLLDEGAILDGELHMQETDVGYPQDAAVSEQNSSARALPNPQDNSVPALPAEEQGN